ncbi:hypothetical protein CL634_00050 [bacterium]|nr:hypothetical protein [bacterium]
MAQYKKTDLTSKINTDLADNTSGAISASDVRINMVNIVDSIIPIMASGADTYFYYDVNIKDAGVTTADSAIGYVYGKWDDNNVAAIGFKTGSDTTNKDDGAICFYTAPSGSASLTGGPGLKKRMEITPLGQVLVYGSGLPNPSLRVKSIHDSGVNILLDGSPRNIAYPSGNSFQIGEWDSRSSTFTQRVKIDPKGRFGINVDHPEQPLHVRSSGEAIRLDSHQHSNADLILTKWKTATQYSKNDYYVGFGLGVTTSASGAGRFFIGVDGDRDFSVAPADHIFVLDSGGRAGFGSLYPSEKLVVGDDLGNVASSSLDGNASVIGSATGRSQLFIGSGVGTTASNFARVMWEPTYNQARFSTRKGYAEHQHQLILDGTNGNVGVSHSGIRPVNWRPKHNLHVSGSGGAVSLAVESPINQGASLYLGKNTLGSGVLVYPTTDDEIGHWSAIGYKSASEVLKINNSGSFVPSHVTINRLGQVGINTEVPYNNTSIGTDWLHVYGSNSAVIVGDPLGASDSALRLLGSRSTNNTAYIQAGTSAADTNAKLAISRFDTDGVNVSEFNVYSDLIKIHGNFALNGNWISNDGGSEGIKVGDTGNVAVGKVPGGTHVFELNSGQGAQATSTLWVNTSDERIKENIVTIDTSSALDKVMQLRPVSFNYIEDFCVCKDVDQSSTFYNFIAQEVETVFPDSVLDTDSELEDHTNGGVLVSNLKGLDSHAINIHLVAAVQELKTQLDAALVRISQLESS